MVKKQVKDWVPDAGDVIWVDLDPTVGHEQSGKRPCLVLSPALYNGRSGLLVACAMTKQVKKYPWEVPTHEGFAVLADTIKSIDWRFRMATLKEKAPPHVLEEVQHMVRTLLEL